jgi:hypothetical protein
MTSKSDQDSEEKAFEASMRMREFQDTVKRLEDHIHDLETRKRAPLYQKRQEEELKAAIEKAQEADARAAEAELKCKEARVRGPKHHPATLSVCNQIALYYLFCLHSCGAWLTNH